MRVVFLVVNRRLKLGGSELFLEFVRGRWEVILGLKLLEVSVFFKIILFEFVINLRINNIVILYFKNKFVFF